MVSDAARRPMTAQDITRITWVSDPQISPDGARVAFVATTLSEEKDEYLSQIWMVDTAGGAPRRFTGGPKRDTEPQWSPDGRRLAFVSERETKKKGQLYVMAADGGEPACLTDLKRGVRVPTLSNRFGRMFVEPLLPEEESVLDGERPSRSPSPSRTSAVPRGGTRA